MKLTVNWTDQQIEQRISWNLRVILPEQTEYETSVGQVVQLMCPMYTL